MTSNLQELRNISGCGFRKTAKRRFLQNSWWWLRENRSPATRGLYEIGVFGISFWPAQHGSHRPDAVDSRLPESESESSAGGTIHPGIVFPSPWDTPQDTVENAVCKVPFPHHTVSVAKFRSYPPQFLFLLASGSIVHTAQSIVIVVEITLVPPGKRLPITPRNGKLFRRLQNQAEGRKIIRHDPFPVRNQPRTEEHRTSHVFRSCQQCLAQFSSVYPDLSPCCNDPFLNCRDLTMKQKDQQHIPPAFCQTVQLFHPAVPVKLRTTPPPALSTKQYSFLPPLFFCQTIRAKSVPTYFCTWNSEYIGQFLTGVCKIWNQTRVCLPEIYFGTLFAIRIAAYNQERKNKMTFKTTIEHMRNRRGMYGYSPKLFSLIWCVRLS